MGQGRGRTEGPRGGPGALGRTRIVRADGRVDELRSADKTEMAAGDLFWLDTPSGGGCLPEE